MSSGLDLMMRCGVMKMSIRITPIWLRLISTRLQAIYLVLGCVIETWNNQKQKERREREIWDLDFGETTKEEGGEGLRLVNEMNEERIWFGFVCLVKKKAVKTQRHKDKDKEKSSNIYVCFFN